MTHKMVNLSATSTGDGSTGSPFDRDQFVSSIGLTGDTGDVARYQIEGLGTWTGEHLDIKRDGAIVESSQKTPARMIFNGTGVHGIRILNQSSGNTSEQSVRLSKLMLEKIGQTGETGDRLALILVNNEGATNSSIRSHFTLWNSVLRADYDSGTGQLIRDNSTGAGSNTHDIKGNDLLAVGENVDNIIEISPSYPCTVNIDSCSFEGHAIPIKKDVTGAGEYKYSAFHAIHDVTYKNTSLIQYVYSALDNTVQYQASVDLSSVSIGDDFVDSIGNNYNITNVWDGLDRIELSGITGAIDTTAPTSTEQGSIVKEYREISVGVGGTGGSTGALPGGANNKDNRDDVTALSFPNDSIAAMTLPTSVMPKAGSDLIDQGNPSLGLNIDLLGETRTTPDIGAKEYRLMLNAFAAAPKRDSVTVRSTINKSAVVAMTDLDDYFDNMNEVAKVEIWYVHEDGRQTKYLLHQGPAGGNLICDISWTANAEAGVWNKKRMRVVGFNGSEIMVRGQVTASNLEDIILQ